MGVVPLQYEPGQSAETLGLSGKERFTIELPNSLKPQQKTVVRTDTGKEFNVSVRFDTELELVYFKNGGILHYMIRKVLGQK
jgi:aconitate hydratase